MAEIGREVVILVCDECALYTALGFKKLPIDFLRIPKTDQNGAGFFRVVSLADCANAYASVMSIQPRSADKITKINLCFYQGLYLE